MGPATGTWDWMVAKQGAWGVGVCNGNLVACYYDWGSSRAYDSATALNPNTWYFLAAVISGGTETVYLDGSNILSGTLTVSSQSTTGLQIGYGNCCGQLLNGLASNIQIYNTSMDANSITALYLEGIGGAPISPQHLVAWWPLNGDMNDYSGNDNGGVSTSISYTSSWSSGYAQP